MKMAAVAEGQERAGLPNVYLGMILFLISEVFLFGALFWTYFYLSLHALVWPPQGVHPETSLAVVNTVILLLSSGTMQWAISAARRGSRRGLVWGLLTTLLLGGVFLGIKGWEWVSNSFRPWDHAYGSIFYTLTGFHGLHVLGGLLLLGALLSRAVRHGFSAERPLAVEVAGLYWHFVDVVWLFVFGSIFILR